MTAINDYGRWEVMQCLYVIGNDSRHSSLRGLGEVDWALSGLLDTWRVFDDPDAMVNDLLYADEVEQFKDAGRLVLEMIADLGGNAPDEVYVRDPRWGQVVNSAREILEGMFQRPPDGEDARQAFSLPPRQRGGPL